MVRGAIEGGEGGAFVAVEKEHPELADIIRQIAEHVPGGANASSLEAVILHLAGPKLTADEQQRMWDRASGASG